MTARLVSTDLRHGEYIVATYSRTPKGIWVLDGTPTLLPETSTDKQLGAAVRAALARSRTDFPEVTRDSRPARLLLEFLRLPDFATYAEGTKSVGVRSESTDAGETIKVTPRRNETPERGFTPIIEAAQTYVYESPEQLGAAVREAFTKAV